MAIRPAWDWLGELISVGLSLQEAEFCTSRVADGRDVGRLFRKDALEDNTAARICGNPLDEDFVPIPPPKVADVLRRENLGCARTRVESSTVQPKLGLARRLAFQCKLDVLVAYEYDTRCEHDYRYGGHDIKMWSG